MGAKGADVNQSTSDLTREFLRQQAALGERWIVMESESDPVASPAELEPRAEPVPSRSVSTETSTSHTWTAPDGREVEGSARRVALAKLFYETKDCSRCRLAETRNRFVFGMGAPNARVVFVGEAPGAEEDRTGLPFVGRAGQLLDQLLGEVGIDRKEDVFICNVLKCRPPGNRDPKADEITECQPILKRQLEVIQPKVVCTLGRFAAQTLLGTDTSMGRLRQKEHRFGGLPLVATYHPAYVLRNPAAADDLRTDLSRMRVLMDRQGDE